MNSLYNLDVNPFSDMSFMNIFSHTVGCFCSTDGILCCTEAFYFDIVPLVHFSFVSLAWGDIFMKKLLKFMSKRFLPMFFSKSFMFHDLHSGL